MKTLKRLFKLLLICLFSAQSQVNWQLRAMNVDAQVLQENQPENNPVLPEGVFALPGSPGKSKNGWHIRNISNQELYAAWYLFKDQPNGVWTRIDEQMHILKCDEEKHIPFPDRPNLEKRFFEFNPQRRLLVSTNRHIHADEIKVDAEGNLPQGIVAFSQHDLGTFQGKCTLLVTQNGPEVRLLNKDIRLNNTTSKELYAALYDVELQDGTATKCDLDQKLSPQLSAILKLPQWGLRLQKSKKIILLLSETKEKLQPKMAQQEWSKLINKSFESSNWYDYYWVGSYDIIMSVAGHYSIVGQGGGFFNACLRSIGDINPFTVREIENLENKLQAAPLPEANPDVVVTTGKTSNLQREKAYLDERIKIVRKALNDLINDPEYMLDAEEAPPTVAFVFSGGGIRALTATTGYLRGADNDEGGNIFNCSTHMMGLSGSTWAINTLVASGMRPSEFAEKQRTKLGKDIKQLYFELINDSIDYRKRRFMQSRYNQYTGIIGNYGHALGNALCKDFSVNGKQTHDITLSDLQAHLEKAEYPLPISVATYSGETDTLRTWYEFSPYTVGTAQHGGGWVDTKYFGSHFKAGSLQQAIPELPLTYYFGVWGSAFALAPQDIAKSSTLGGIAAYTVSTLSWLSNQICALMARKVSKTESDRLTEAHIANFFYQMKDGNGMHSILANKETIPLIDGGITKDASHRHNFASVPALCREIDVLIMCDAHEHPNKDKASHLVAAAKEARRLGLPFPEIKEEGPQAEALKKQVSTLIMPTHDNEPMVLYMTIKRNAIYDEKIKENLHEGFDPDSSAPFKGGKHFTPTVNFSYTEEQYDLLTGLSEEIFMQSKEQIKDALKKAIKRKRSARKKA